MSGPDQDEEDGVVQRTVSAADAPPLQARVGSSVFNWRCAGTAADAAPDTTADTQSQPEEEETMATAKKKSAPRKNSGASPQLQICSALLQNDLARDAIVEAVPDLKPAQIASALNNAKSQGRIAWIENDEVFRLTKTGKAWVAGATGSEEPAAPTVGTTRRKGGHRRGRAAKAKKVDTSPVDEAEATFRCAVMSDGCFFLSKEGESMELTVEEHKQMLDYLDRMREPEEA